MPWNGLYAYWRGKHRNGMPPSRRQLDPVLEIPRLLPNVFLIDVEEDAFRFRLAGSDIVQRIGDPAGRVIEAGWLRQETMTALRPMLEKVRDQRVPALYQINSEGCAVYSATGLLTPLIDDSGKTEFILGGLFFSKAWGAGRSPGDKNLRELDLPEDG